MHAKCTPENEKYIQQVLDEGAFESASEVVNEALRLLRERSRRMGHLRGEIQEGIDSGPSLSFDDAFRRLNRKADELDDRERKGR